MTNDDLNLPVSRRDIILIMALAGSVLFALFIVKWAQEPDFRPLIQDIRLIDAVKIADILDQNKVLYKTDIASHMIFVAEDQNTKARVALARAGIEIDYPRFERTADITGLCAKAGEDFKHCEEVPLWQQPWAMRALKLIMGGLVLIVFILAIVRPMLRHLLYPEDIE